ncbi:MAG: hypothetical protein RLZ15_933 [Actinomycetota bacterium]
MANSNSGVLVVDFGAQYAQLIARRVREANVFSEIVPSHISAAEVKAKNPQAIILSGGPSSVYEEHAPTFDNEILKLGIPVFGICYGFQAMAAALGGVVTKTGKSGSSARRSGYKNWKIRVWSHSTNCEGIKDIQRYSIATIGMDVSWRCSDPSASWIYYLRKYF